MVCYYMPCEYKRIILEGGWLGVEFFFILSGFFMGNALNEDRHAEYKNEDVSVTIRATWKYLFHRIKAVFPYLIVSMIIGMGVWAYSNNWNFSYIKSYVCYVLNDILFLQSWGYPSASICGVMWYLSSLFLSFNRITPLLCNSRNPQISPMHLLHYYSVDLIYNI